MSTERLPPGPGLPAACCSTTTVCRAAPQSRRRQRSAFCVRRRSGRVTLTGLYNPLAKLRSGEVFNAKDKLLHEQGLVCVLRTLHDEIDAAVLQAYGWADLTAALADHTLVHADARAAAVETLLERLVAPTGIESHFTARGR